MANERRKFATIIIRNTIKKTSKNIAVYNVYSSPKIHSVRIYLSIKRMQYSYRSYIILDNSVFYMFSEIKININVGIGVSKKFHSRIEIANNFLEIDSYNI